MPESDTKTRILDAAEGLFADRGFADTSLRAITTVAGVNLAAVNYHFGSKKELAKAVVGRLAGPINTERLRLLDAAEHEPTPPSLQAIVRAFVEPAARVAAEPGNHLRVFAHVVTGPESIRGAVAENFETVSRRFVAAIGRAVPGLEGRELLIRWRLFFGSFIALLVPGPSIKEHARQVDPDPLALMDSFVVYSAAALSAPARGANAEAGRP